MEVTYELTPEDMWQWTLYYRRHKNYLRPSFLAAWLATLGIITACFLFVIGADLLRNQPVPQELLLYFPSTLWLLYRFLPWSRKRTLRRFAKDPNQFCQHTLRINPTWIEEETPYSQNKMAWSRLTSIEEDSNYLYLCVRSAGAHVIPKRAFASSLDAQNFVDMSRNYWDVAKYERPVSAEDQTVWPPAPRTGA